MTMFDERMRRVGDELDRAAVAFGAQPTERTYVATAPPRGRRPRVLVTTAAVVALVMVAALALRASRHDDPTVTALPDGLAIAENLGDAWLWPNADSGVRAGTADDVTREFATRVLGLSAFTVAHQAPDPVGMRIDTPAMSLSLTTNKVPASPDRWAIFQLESTRLSLSDDGLVAATPLGTTSVDLYVRYANTAGAFRLDVDPAGGAVVLPLQGTLVSALVVFRNSRGEVIDAASVDAQTVTAQTRITCTFETNGDHAMASLHAVLGETAVATVGAYSAHVEVVEGRTAGEEALRVSVSGPQAGTSFAAMGDLVRAKGLGDGGVLSGTSDAQGVRFTYACIGENPMPAIASVGQTGPRFDPDTSVPVSR